MERTDTLGQTVYTCESDYAIVLLSIVPEDANQKNVHYRFDGIAELKEFYDGMEQGSSNSTGGEISASNDLKIDSFYSRDFTVQLPNSEFKRFVATIVKDQLFMLWFWYHEDFEKEVSLEIERTIESMDFNLLPSEQLNPKRTEDSLAYKLGELFAKVTVYIFVPGIIYLIYRVRKRNRNANS